MLARTPSRLSSLIQLESLSEAFIQRILLGCFFLLTLFILTTYPWRMLTMEDWTAPAIWWENTSSYNIPEEYKSLLTQRMQELNFPADPALKNGNVHELFPGQVQIFFVNSVDLPREFLAELPQNVRANASVEGRTIYVYLDRVLKGGGSPEVLVNLTMHEIGHAMGKLEHTEGEKNVMFPKLNFKTKTLKTFWPWQRNQLQRDWL